METQGLMQIDKVVVDVKEVDGKVKQIAKLSISFVINEEETSDTLFDLIRMQGQTVTVSFETRQTELKLEVVKVG